MYFIRQCLSKTIILIQIWLIRRGSKPSATRVTPTVRSAVHESHLRLLSDRRNGGLRSPVAGQGFARTWNSVPQNDLGSSWQLLNPMRSPHNISVCPTPILRASIFWRNEFGGGGFSHQCHPFEKSRLRGVAFSGNNVRKKGLCWENKNGWFWKQSMKEMFWKYKHLSIKYSHKHRHSGFFSRRTVKNAS